MEKPTHTPEPWNSVFNPALDVFVRDKNGLILAKMRAIDGIDHQANAARIVECVNAMEGIEDPSNLRATWDAIKELELDKYIELKKVIVDVIKLIDEGRELHPTSIIIEALRHAIK